MGKKALKYLIKALKDNHPAVQKHAARALGKIGNPYLIIPIREAMKDERWYIRLEIEEAILEIAKKQKSEY